ncbi:MAG: hypothetical protein MZV64_42185, partial [Ignavibacteriales bacterium]|nr:hypothetical protein [Ignavibacteriales bacterium]
LAVQLRIAKVNTGPDNFLQHLAAAPATAMDAATRSARDEPGHPGQRRACQPSRGTPTVRLAPRPGVHGSTESGDGEPRGSTR